MPVTSRPPLALIAGPTASGKSALAIALAEATGGVIVNADSAQVYRDLRILSARPSAADEARVEHRLYGTRDSANPCSAADWAADARAAIDALHAAGRLPILVGGTGLYLRTLLDGIAPVPAIDGAVRDVVRARSAADNGASLLVEDPRAAARLGPADSQRIARALEVVRSTGRSILDWHQTRGGGIAEQVRLAACVLLPPRAWLGARSDARFDAMASPDGLAEVDALLARRLDPTLPVMTAIGVRELAALLGGRVSRDEALRTGRAVTRRYAKRQTTWFRNQPPPEWRRAEEPLETEARIAEVAAALAAECGRR